MPSYLLLHDVQPDTELTRTFKTPALWGLAYTGTYWHDGRASTINEAIQIHAGEALNSKIAWENLSIEEQEALLIFLKHL